MCSIQKIVFADHMKESWVDFLYEQTHVLANMRQKKSSRENVGTRAAVRASIVVTPAQAEPQAPIAYP